MHRSLLFSNHFNSRREAEEVFSSTLDEYPGAVTAISLRRLRGGYTGPLIRVRRSSDNTEQDIGYLAEGTLDTAALLAFTGAGSGFITRWYDQSVSAPIDFTQTTAASQPRIVNSGVYETMGAFFDGGNDFLNGGPTPIPDDFTGDFSFISVNQCANTEAGYIISFAIGSTGSALYANTSGSGTYDIRNGIAGGNQISKTSAENIIQAYYNNTTTQFRLNGVDGGTSGGVYNFTSSSANLIIGNRTGGGTAGTFFNGFLKEAILYSTDKRADRVGINNSINSAWGVY